MEANVGGRVHLSYQATPSCEPFLILVRAIENLESGIVTVRDT